MTASARMLDKPLAVRVLWLSAWATLLLGLVAFGIGAILSFDELAKVWAVVGGILLVTALAAFIGTRPTTGGLISALVACTLLLLLPPLGTLLTIAIALIASQSWPHVRDYYGLRRRSP